MTQGFVPSGLVKHSSRTVNECLIVLDRGAGVVGLELGLVRASGARESNIKSVANRTVKSGAGYILVIDDHAELCKLVSS